VAKRHDVHQKERVCRGVGANSSLARNGLSAASTGDPCEQRRVCQDRLLLANRRAQQDWKVPCNTEGSGPPRKRLDSLTNGRPPRPVSKDAEPSISTVVLRLTPALRESLRHPFLRSVGHVLLCLGDLRPTQLAADEGLQLPTQRVRSQLDAESVALALQRPEVIEDLDLAIRVIRPERLLQDRPAMGNRGSRTRGAQRGSPAFVQSAPSVDRTADRVVSVTDEIPPALAAR
jgi:hypothetical protein